MDLFLLDPILEEAAKLSWIGCEVADIGDISIPGVDKEDIRSGIMYMEYPMSPVNRLRPKRAERLSVFRVEKSRPRMRAG